jgi:ligand-binding SRPBCC domain-containing protein
MQRQFADVGAEGIAEEAARTWIHGLVSAQRRAITVREIWLSASRRVFGWARRHKKIRQNPFVDVRVDVPRKAQTREEGRSFTDGEAITILRASLAYEKPLTPTEKTRRWLPWLCA